MTLDLKLTYLRPLSVRSGLLRAEGRVVKLGRQTSYTEGFVHDGAGKLAVHAYRDLLDDRRGAGAHPHDS